MDWITLFVGMVIGFFLGFLASSASASDQVIRTGQEFVNGLLHKVKSGESAYVTLNVGHCKDDDDEEDDDEEEEPPCPCCCDEDVKPEVFVHESWRNN